MILAELNTEHFEFKACGPSIAAAREEVALAFQRHLAQHDSGPQDWADTVDGGYVDCSTLEKFIAALIDWYGINTYDFGNDNSVALRDGEQI